MSWTALLDIKPPQTKFETFGDKVTLLLEQGRIKKDETSIYGLQREAVLKTKEYFWRKIVEGKLDEANPALIVAPTGAGKTGIIALLPYVLKSKKVLVLTPNTWLTDQIGSALGKHSECHSTREESFFEKVGMFTSRDDLDHIIEPPKLIKSSSEINERVSSNVVIVNAQKFAGNSKTTLSIIYQDEIIIKNVQTFFRRFDTLIVDEAHHYPADTWKNILTEFRKKVDGMEKKIIFLTATPYRKNNQPILGANQDDHIAFVCEDDHISGKTIRKAVFCDDGDDERNLSDDLCNILDDHEEKYRFKPQAMIVVFRTEEAEKVAKLLNTTNKWGDKRMAVAIYSDTRQCITDFTEGRYRVAVVCNLFVEGYDNSNVTTCVILRKIKVPLRFKQFIGRCRRIKKDIIGGHPDTTVAVIRSYKNYNQREMWDEFDKGAISDPPNDDFELLRTAARVPSSSSSHDKESRKRKPEDPSSRFRELRRRK